MSRRYLETYLTPAVKAAQREAYGRTLEVSGAPARDRSGRRRPRSSPRATASLWPP